MSPLLRHSLIALVVAVFAFGLTYALLQPSAAPDELDELAWMQKEFRLTPAQTDAIGKLHDDYFPVCMDHCRRIVRARDALASATPDLRPAAQAELTRLENVCQEATRAHLQRVAAAMTPEQGQRFLSLVGPKISGHSHKAPLGLK